MKITFATDGGFAYVPALNRPFTIDTLELDQKTADRLHSLLQSVRFFDQPAVAGVPPRGADYQTYTITVDDGLRVHTVQLNDLIMDAELEQLVSVLRDLARPKKKP